MQICAHDRGTAPLITQGEAIITGGCAAQVMEKPSLRATSTGLCHMYLQIELPSLSLSLPITSNIPAQFLFLPVYLFSSKTFMLLLSPMPQDWQQGDCARQWRWERITSGPRSDYEPAGPPSTEAHSVRG